MSGRRCLAAQDHAAMMQCVGVDEIAVGGETRVVPVLDMRPVDLVAALIGSLALTAGLDVPPFGRSSWRTRLSSVTHMPT